MMHDDDIYLFELIDGYTQSQKRGHFDHSIIPITLK